MAKQKTSVLDELEKGPWPSHVTELKKTKYAMGMYEEALEKRESQWRTGGGYILIPGVPSGVMPRMSKRPDILKESSVIRIFPPSGHFFTTDLCRKLCAIADQYSRGLIHFFATAGDIEFIEVPHEKILEMVKEIEKIGLDVGSTGHTFRSMKTCIGTARCDVSLIDTIGLRQAFTERFLDDMQYPRFPHRIKSKAAGCPNDCVHGIHKSEIFVCGVFKDLPKVDQGKLREWVDKGGDIAYICSRCPKLAMYWDGNKLKIDEACVRCMYCINQCPAIRPGGKRGAAILVGGKFRNKVGPALAKVLVPFIKAKHPEYKEILDLIYKVGDVYDEHAMPKERMAEFLSRFGFDKFIKLVGVEPTSHNLFIPRENLFYQWKKEELE